MSMYLVNTNELTSQILRKSFHPVIADIIYAYAKMLDVPYDEVLKEYKRQTTNVRNNNTDGLSTYPKDHGYYASSIASIARKEKAVEQARRYMFALAMSNCQLLKEIQATTFNAYVKDDRASVGKYKMKMEMQGHDENASLHDILPVILRDFDKKYSDPATNKIPKDVIAETISKLCEMWDIGYCISLKEWSSIRLIVPAYDFVDNVAYMYKMWKKNRLVLYSTDDRQKHEFEYGNMAKVLGESGVGTVSKKKIQHAYGRYYPYFAVYAMYEPAYENLETSIDCLLKNGCVRCIDDWFLVAGRHTRQFEVVYVRPK